jgi:dihydropyrimidinase
MLDLALRGGRVVAADGVSHLDIGISDGQVVAIAQPGWLPESERTIDASGKLVIPGGIDPHVHSSSPVPRPDGSWDLSFPPSVVSRAALFGGTTMLMDFAMCRPGMTLAESIDIQTEAWRDGLCDYSHHIQLQGAVPPEVMAEMPSAIEAGYPSFKIYTTDVKPTGHEVGRIDHGHILALLQQAARSGGILVIHAEDDDLVMYAYEALAREGRTGYEEMPAIHSVMSEDLAFRRIVRLAGYVDGASVYLVHTGTRVGVDAIAQARSNGQAIFGETLHQYLFFDSGAYLRPDGVKYHTYPSLKSVDDQARLWSGLLDGSLSTVATDEMGTSREVKLEQRSASDAVGGHVGVETRIPVMYTEGVVKRGMTLDRFVEVTSTNAARIFGMYPAKGVIAIGSDADLVVFDPTVRRVLRAEDLHGSDYSIWEGWETHGWPETTILRGMVAVEHGELVARPGDGQRVARKLSPDARPVAVP